MTPTEVQVAALMKRYNELTGQELTHRGVCNPRTPFWQLWMQKGFTMQDLDELIRWLQRQIKIGERKPGCLRFSTLIGDVFKFEEELNMMRAERRNAKPPVGAKERTVACLRPTVAPAAPATSQKPAKAIGEWIGDLRKSVERKDP